MTRQTKAALAYVLGFISGIVLLAIEKDDEFIRKCSAQSIVFSILCIAAAILLGLIPLAGNILRSCFSLFVFMVWVALIIKASKNIYFRLPLISNIAEKYILK